MRGLGNPTARRNTDPTLLNSDLIPSRCAPRIPDSYKRDLWITPGLGSTFEDASHELAGEGLAYFELTENGMPTRLSDRMIRAALRALVSAAGIPEKVVLRKFWSQDAETCLYVLARPDGEMTAEAVISGFVGGWNEQSEWERRLPA